MDFDVSAKEFKDFETVAKECAPWVNHKTLAAIVRRESSFRQFVININYDSQGKRGYVLARQPKNEEEAVVTARNLIKNGYNIDVGLTGVNSSNFGKYRLVVEDSFNVCKNLAVGGSIIYWNFIEALKLTPHDEQKALKVGLSMYNTGSKTRGFENGYVQKIIDSASMKVPEIKFKF